MNAAVTSAATVEVAEPIRGVVIMRQRDTCQSDRAGCQENQDVRRP